MKEFPIKFETPEEYSETFYKDILEEYNIVSFNIQKDLTKNLAKDLLYTRYFLIKSKEDYDNLKNYSKEESDNKFKNGIFSGLLLGIICGICIFGIFNFIFN